MSNVVQFPTAPKPEFDELFNETEARDLIRRRCWEVIALIAITPTDRELNAIIVSLQAAGCSAMAMEIGRLLK